MITPILALQLAVAWGRLTTSGTNAQILESLEVAAKAGRYQEIKPGLLRLRKLTSEDAEQLEDFLNGTLVNEMETKDRTGMLQLLRVAFDRGILGDPTRVPYWQTKSTEARLLEVLGKHDEALQTLDTTIPKTSQVGKDVLGRLRSHLALVGQPAPPIPMTRQIGSFPGLDQWKGRVVVVDFFAHWCGPCVAELPEIKAIYKDHHASGLEIVGATDFFGFYRSKKTIGKDEEFQDMEGFVKEKELPWPVVYTKGSVNDAYHQLGLPNVIVIDRKGVIREVGYGFFPGEPGKLRRLVEDLLKE